MRLNGNDSWLIEMLQYFESIQYIVPLLPNQVQHYQDLICNPHLNHYHLSIYDGRITNVAACFSVRQTGLFQAYLRFILNQFHSFKRLQTAHFYTTVSAQLYADTITTPLQLTRIKWKWVTCKFIHSVTIHLFSQDFFPHYTNSK